MKWIATILLQLTIVCSSFAQDITNEGTDFWFGYTEVYDKTTAIYEVTISSRTSASGTVLVQGAGFSQNFNVLPGTSERIILPAATVNNEINGALALKAIHIVSDNPVVVFASTVHLHRTEVSVVLPTPALGSEYLVSGKAQVASTDQSEFVVVAAGDSCRVQITTTADCGPGGSVASAGVPFEITIDSGEVFQVQTTAIGSNLAGSEIIAVNGTDVFAVYSGNVFINIEATYNKDPLFEVEYPVSSWGREYIVPRVHGVSYSAYQVIAKENATEIFVNGSITPNATIDRGESYEDTMRNHEVIVASKPVKVMHYLPSSSLTSPGTSGVGDPAMAGIGPNKHMFLDTVTFYQHEGWLLDSHFVNIVTRSLDTNSVQLDGSTLSGWESLGAMPEYSTKTVKTDTGAYTLTTSGCGFFVYSYGYRWAESYYYSAGVLLNTSEDSIIASNLTSSGSNCANDSILFEATTGYGAPVSYSWYFGDGDSSSLDSPTHQYSNPGSYQVSVIINYSCISDTIVDSIHMLSCGITALSDTTICLGNSVELSVSGGSGSFSWADASDLSAILGSGTSFFAIPAGTTVYGVYNSSDTAYVTVTVQNCPNCNNNIVPNPSFENTIYCPTAMDELSATPPWSNPPPNPYQGSAEAFNQCGLTLGVDAAHSGIGHAGVVVYEPTATFREYLQVQLDSVMQPGDCYQVSMYVKLSESLGSTFSIDSLGMHISSAPPVQSSGGTGLMNVTPQITNDATADLTSYSWQLISGTYTASGGEQFISIGNFADDINSNPVQIGPISFEGYYVVDDICIYKIEPDTFDLSVVNDTVSCAASVLLNAPSGYSNYSWLDSTNSIISSSASLLVSATGPSQHVLFFVDTSTCPITYYRDSVLVQLVTPPDAGLPGNINICSSSAGVTMTDSLGGFPDTVGYWLPSTAVNGTFDPASDTPGTYNYIVSNGICDNDTAELYISIESGLSSGTAGSISICSTAGNFDLMNSLGGTPDAGGTWSPPLISGTGIFDPGSDPGGTYTYAHAATSACPSSSTESVVMIGIPGDPGGDGTASICPTATPFILADSLTGTPNSNGNWTPAIAGITFDPALNGSGTYIYEITGTDGCPDSSSSVLVTIHPEPTVTIGNDTIVQPNSSFSLIATGGYSYSWSPSDGLSCSDCPNPIVIASSDIEYCVLVTDTNGCTKSDCMNIYLDLSGSVWAPNIFSPNSDGLNDVFYVRGPIDPGDYRFLVFNRWGEVVFETEDPNMGWDGTQNGVKLNTGVFNYLALGATLPGTEFKLYGNITLFVK